MNIPSDILNLIIDGYVDLTDITQLCRTSKSVFNKCVYTHIGKMYFECNKPHETGIRILDIMVHAIRKGYIPLVKKIIGCRYMVYTYGDNQYLIISEILKKSNPTRLLLLKMIEEYFDYYDIHLATEEIYNGIHMDIPTLKYLKFIDIYTIENILLYILTEALKQDNTPVVEHIINENNYDSSIITTVIINGDLSLFKKLDISNSSSNDISLYIQSAIGCGKNDIVEYLISISKSKYVLSIYDLNLLNLQNMGNLIKLVKQNTRKRLLLKFAETDNADRFHTLYSNIPHSRNFEFQIISTVFINCSKKVLHEMMVMSTFKGWNLPLKCEIKRAVKHGDIEMIQMVVEYLAKTLDSVILRKIFTYAAGCGKLEIVKYAYELSCKRKLWFSIYQNNCNAIRLAAKGKHIAVLKYIMSL